MLKEVSLSAPYSVIMTKNVWSEQEISLAKCYNFEFDCSGSNMKISCDIRRAAKNSLLLFISLSFRALTESVLRKREYETLTFNIDKMYYDMNGKRESIIKEKLPYFDMLRTYQGEGVSLMLGRKHNMLSFEQGMGKSITAASVSKVMNIKRTLIICIPVAKWNWQADLVEKFGYDPLRFSILDSKNSKTIKAISPYHERFVIVHYEAIPKHLDYILAQDIGHIIIDECQNIKNHNSNKYKNIEKIANHFPGAKISFVSGTPIKNRVDDLFAYFKLSGHELGKNRAQFIRDFANVKNGRNVEKVVSAKNIDKLTTCMANFMIRKNKKECPELPDRNYMKVLLDIGDYRDEYDKVMLELLQNNDKGAINGSLISLNRILAMAKVKAAIEHIEDLVDKGEKVIVFTSFKDPINMLEQHFGNRCVKVDGTVEHSERFLRVKRFVEDESCQVFLGNMVAAGTSLNLTVASEVLFLNYPFTATDIAQAVDRAHRLGQENKVNVYFFTCKDTIDEILYNLVGSKQGEINQIIDGGEGVDYGKDVSQELYRTIANKNSETFQ